MEIDLDKLGGLHELGRYLSSSMIEQLARESGFILRTSSRLSGEAFLHMMLQPVCGDGHWSLNDQCDFLQERFGIDMAKQSLDERYHTYTVSFMKHCYEAVLSAVLSDKVTGFRTAFNGIYLTDSTSYQLPAGLSPFYQSNGGSTTGSSVKVHQTLELSRFQIADLLITDGKSSDGNYWREKGLQLGSNNLWIGDLGYFSWDTLEDIAESENYFLSRYKTGTNLYIRETQGKYTLFDVPGYVKQLSSGKGQSVAVYFGKGRDKRPCRLVCSKVPQEVRELRLSRYDSKHRGRSKRGKQWNQTEEKRLLCGYNLYITNAPEDMLTDEVISSIYGLRWQIELLFKIWKSLLCIDKVGKMNIFRFESFLYGRLIFILLSTELVAFIKETVMDNKIEVELSEWKTIKLIKKTLGDTGSL